MHEGIEKLLILQDRDRKILRVREELMRIPAERAAFQAQAAESKAAADENKLRCNKIESDRKELELQVEARKQQIDKYSLQQFQTKKNEEYRALAKEIETCKKQIRELEDKQLELMEQAEIAQKEGKAIAKQAADVKKNVEGWVAELSVREQNLNKEIGQLEANRDELASGIEESLLAGYERLLSHRGQNVVVGIQHGVCGGCHMKLNAQILVSCQAAQEVVNCNNCGRILYYTPNMDIAVAE